MNSEIREILRREISELEEQITHQTALWQQMKDRHEIRWKYRRMEPEHDTDDEIEWEERSRITEYYALYITPLEEKLAEKRRSLALFD